MFTVRITPYQMVSIPRACRMGVTKGMVSSTMETVSSMAPNTSIRRFMTMMNVSADILFSTTISVRAWGICNRAMTLPNNSAPAMMIAIMHEVGTDFRQIPGMSRTLMVR